MTTPSVESLRYALAYARRGWPVLPCRGKVPAGDLVRHGVKDATTDADVLRRWFADPELNVGLACEPLAVLDVDPRADDRGRPLHELLADLGPLPESAPRVATGGGGTHVYFAGPAPGAKPRPWLDVKGSGGYVIAPPSVHPATGRVYTFTVEPSGPPPALPERFTERKPGARAPMPSSELVAIARGAPAGDRNRQLARLAGHLLAKNVDAALTRELVVMVAARCRPPLPGEEALRIVESIARAELRQRNKAGK